MIALLCASLGLAVELPPRPVQSSGLAPGDCPETAVIDGQPDPLPSCSGIVLGLSAWAEVERLAADSRMVRELWVVQELEHRLELEAAHARIEHLEQPEPFAARNRGWLAGAGVLSGVLLWELARREIER